MSVESATLAFRRFPVSTAQHAAKLLKLLRLVSSFNEHISAQVRAACNPTASTHVRYGTATSTTLGEDLLKTPHCQSLTSSSSVFQLNIG